MTAILSILAVFGTAVWFYTTAQKLRLSGLSWAIGGVIVYYIGFLFWMHLLLRPLMGDRFQNHTFWIGISMDMSAIVFGVLLMYLFRQKVLLKKTAG